MHYYHQIHDRFRCPRPICGTRVNIILQIISPNISIDQYIIRKSDLPAFTYILKNHLMTLIQTILGSKCVFFCFPTSHRTNSKTRIYPITMYVFQEPLDLIAIHKKIMQLDWLWSLDSYTH